jgi:endonuclease YncB( thermonuclease family)
MTFRDGVVLVAMLVLLTLIVARLNEASDDVMGGPFHAVDGDTLSAGGERLRLEGIDAPELDQTCEDGGGRRWACGAEARRHLARLVSTDETECRGHERDRYDRLLVRCHVGAVNVNGTMVRQGLAIAYGLYLQEQNTARRERLRLWAGRFEDPRDWRASRGTMDDSGFLEVILDWFARLIGWNGNDTHGQS